jgi:hypothetical protein
MNKRSKQETAGLKIREKRKSTSVLFVCLSVTNQQYFSLRTNQPAVTSQQYFSLRINQHQPPAKRTHLSAGEKIEKQETPKSR